MTWLLYVSVTLLMIICIFLVLLILIQKGRGGGLSGAFGGGGGGNTAFGSKTGDVLTWATSVVFGIFLVLAIVTNVTADKLDKEYKKKVSDQQQLQQDQPSATPLPNNPLNNTSPGPSAPSSQPMP